MPTFWQFKQYASYIIFFVSHKLSLLILNILPVAKHLMAVVSTTKLLQESHFFLQLLHYLEGLSWCCTDHFLVINLSYYSPFYLLQEYDFFENKRENNLEDL